MHFTTDILVIGAGITGCSVAREVSRFDCSAMVIDRAGDVAEGATKANSGIVHAGYDAVTGSAKAKYNVQGAAMFPSLCEKLGVPYRRNGALVIGLTPEDSQTIQKLYDRGVANGVKELRILDGAEALALEPNLNPAVLCALLVPTSAIVSPYELAFALADDAAVNGVSFRFDEEVVSVLPVDGAFEVRTKENVYSCRVVINCAGSSSAAIHNQLTKDSLEIIHRRGQYYLLDRMASPVFDRTIFQCPSVMGKGVLVSPTVHNNLLIGPTAEDIPDPWDTATTASGLANILQKAAVTWPKLNTRSNITNFSGVRAHLASDDFLVGPVSGCPGAFEAVGIESPGLSSAPAIGVDLAAQAAGYLGISRKASLAPLPARPKPFHSMTDEEREAAWKSDPDYGTIVCRCEVVTEAEIKAAIHRPVGARTIDGIKRRTRAGMGRCQGGFCMPRVAAILAQETGRSLLDIQKDGRGSYILDHTIDDAEGRNSL